MKGFKREDTKFILSTYKRNNLLFVKGKGKYLWDSKKRKFLDFFSGLSVTNIGHANRALVSAVKKQAGKLMHVSNLYYTMPQIKLARMLSERSLGGRVFFCNSGAESTETAIKIARKYGGGKRTEIIVFNNAFHGRTLGALSATAQKKFQKYFKPLLPGFRYADFNSIDSVKKRISKKTIAIMIEPVQGEGGVIPAEKGFLRELKRVTAKNKLLLIFDEVQCGIGRTGRLFAYEHFGVKPDILCLAKSLGGGLPMGAVVVNGRLKNIFEYGDHGTTFGGNPVVCSAGIEVLKFIDNDCLKKVRMLGDYFLAGLNGLAGEFSVIRQVRGKGLMLGMELKRPCEAISAGMLDKGVLINCTQDNVLRFLPPFIINKGDIDHVVRILRDILKNTKI